MIFFRHLAFVRIHLAALAAACLFLAGCPGSPPSLAEGGAGEAGPERDLAQDRAASPDGGDGRAGADLGSDPMSYARRAALWLQAVALSAGSGLYWPEYIGDPAWTGSIAHKVNLYGGGAGIGLFFLKMARATGEAGLRKAATAAAEQLKAKAISSSGGYMWKHEVELKDGSIITYDSEGLYSGTAGVGLALLLMGKELGTSGYTDLAKGAATWIEAQATKDAAGCSWLYGQTDIIGGNAGIILFLLELYRETGEAKTLALAKCAASWLIAQGTKDAQGTSWPADTGSSIIYTGMSHGVAGIAYALAALFEVSKDASHLQAAESGASWLLANATCDGAGCRWFHYTPGGTSTYQTGWCHGPAGTARLFLLLYRLTKKQAYLDMAEKAAAWLQSVTDPDKGSTTFWGLSFCCGAASVGEFFLDLYRRTGKAAWLAHAKKIATYLVKNGHEDKGGMAWTNYNYPDSTGRIWYATGLKLGAAGAGWFLLRLAQEGSGAKDWPVLPDERM